MMMVSLSIRWLFLSATLSILSLGEAVSIPGTSQTATGYDNDDGPDAICWRSLGADEGFSMPNPLVKNFIVGGKGVDILNACPPGNNVSGITPVEQRMYGERLRTGRDYNFTVTLNINTTSLKAFGGFVSDNGPGFIAMQILSCVAGLSGFCSPFVHEQALARDAAALAAALAANPDYVPETKKKVRGNLHSGSHVHSGFQLFPLPAEDGPIYKDLTYSIPQRVNTPGNYFTVVTVQMYFWDESELNATRLIRYDMSNKMDGTLSLTAYQDPPDILEVDDGVLFLSYALIGIAGAFTLFMLIEMIRHVKQQVAKLSQGRFLVVFLSAAFVATLAAFLMEPRSDIFCRLSNPIIMVALQTFYAVTIGRLWRINALICPLLLKKLDRDTPWGRFEKLLEKFGCGFLVRASGRNKMHVEVTEKQLWVFVVAMIAPQLLLQALVIILQPRHRVIDFNEDESTGRAVCEPEQDLSLSADIANWGFALFALLIVILLVMASKSRKLPSLFNESKTIFDCTFTSVIIIILGIAIIAVTEDPETSPSVGYLVKIFLILSITANTSIRIVMPKLGMMWRGETVVVSQLVLNHQRSMRASQSVIRSSMGPSRMNSAVSSGGNGVLYDDDLINSTATDHHASKFQSSEFFPEPETERLSPSTDETTPKAEEADVAAEGHDENKSKSPEPKVSFLQSAAEKYESRRNLTNDSKKKGIVISSEEAPSRRLLLKMVDLQEHYSRVTQRIMSGMPVAERDWEQVRSLTGRVETMFKDDVSFAWEQKSEEVDVGGDHLAEIKEDSERVDDAEKTEEGSD